MELYPLKKKIKTQLSTLLSHKKKNDVDLHGPPTMKISSYSYDLESVM